MLSGMVALPGPDDWGLTSVMLSLSGAKDQ
jgi:hypothetical protein